MARFCFIRRFFCCDLQLGTFCVSLFSMALSAVNISFFVQAIDAIKKGQAENKDDLLIRNNLTDAVLKVSYSGIGLSAADLTMGLFLLCGTCQLKVWKLWSWIIWRFFMFAYLVGVTAFFFVAWGKVPPIGIILLVGLVFVIACIIVVYSLTQEIREIEDLKNEVSMDSPAVLLSNQKRLSSPEHYL